MKIDTDQIKNKKFEGPIKSDLQKHSQEYRVLATLRYIFPNRFESMVEREVLDLQDIKNGIGIEVTSAVDWKDMRASSELANLKHKNKNNEKHKIAISTTGYLFLTIKECKYAIYTSGTSYGEKVYFQESIRKKIIKLPQYKAKFQKIGLAVILVEIPTSYTKDHICEWIEDIFDKNDNVFDFLFVISHRFCIYYDVHENIFEKRMINCEENRFLRIIARMTAEGELSLSDEEWK